MQKEMFYLVGAKPDKWDEVRLSGFNVSVQLDNCGYGDGLSYVVSEIIFIFTVAKWEGGQTSSRTS